MQHALLDEVRRGLATLDVSDDKRQRAAEAIERWLTDERFATYRPTIEGLVARGAWDLLLYNFMQTMTFGTGGRRGPVGVGPNAFNPWTLATSVQGHVAFMRERFGDDASLSVVVAFDVRVFRDLRGRYRDVPNPLLGMRSADFARIAAEVYAANGVTVLMPDPDGDRFLATPALSFAIRELDANGGLNISASHNHPDDNGGKFYDHRGAQEVPPHDEHFARIVDGIDDAPQLPFEQARDEGLVAYLPGEIYERYLTLNEGLALEPGAPRTMVAFTNLHGVGDESAGAVLERAGFDVRYVESQRPHDGLFPNVPFRIGNPEVPQSMEAVTALAREVGASVALATDPDADRIGAVVPRRSDDSWVFLNGNEIGAIVTDHVFSRRVLAGTLPEHPFFVTTWVTSRVVTAVARRWGARVVDDLPVGCKYIAEVLRRVEEEGTLRGDPASLDDYVLGLEESHGFLVTPRIRDKDGAGVAVLLAERAAAEASRGRTLYDVLLDVYRAVGVHRTRQVSIVVEGAVGMERIAQVQAAFRALAVGDELAGHHIEVREDRWDVTRYGEFVSETDRAARNIIHLVLGEHVRVLSRPSGTEPKIKLYVEVMGKPLGKNSSDERVLAEITRLDALANDVADGIAQFAYHALGVEMPRWALRLSPLMSLVNRRDFVESVVPELARRAAAGSAPQPLRRWLLDRIAPYGKDAIELVRPALAAWLPQSGLGEDGMALLSEVLDLAESRAQGEAP